MAIVNKYCETCVKASVCEWETKLYKLEGSDKKPGVLELTVNGCDEHFPIEQSEEVDE